MAGKTDGRATLMRAIKAGNAESPLSLDDLRRGGWRDSLPGKAIRIDYEDADGNRTARWITVNAVNGTLLDAYCWLRRESRTFRIDRILEVSDADGECMDAEVFFALARPLDRDSRIAVGKPTETEEERLAWQQRFSARCAEARGEKKLAGSLTRQTETKPPPTSAEQAGGVVVLWLIVVGLGAWLLPVSKGLSTAFGLLFFLSVPWLLAGLIKPRLVLFGADTPTRGQALAVSLAVLAGSLILGVAVDPRKTDSHSAPVSAQAQSDQTPSAQAAPSPALAPTPVQTAQAERQPVKVAVKGIGISRAQAAGLFKALGCPLAEKSAAPAQDRWMGQDGLTACEAAGQTSNLESLFFLQTVTKDEPASIFTGMSKIAYMITVVEPDWPEGGAWVVEAIIREGGDTTRNGRKFHVGPYPPYGLGISIKPAE